MYLLRSNGVSRRAWASVLRVAGRPVPWVPFLLMAAAELGTLLLLTQFHRPAILPFALSIVEGLGSESATHYPFFFFQLPEIQSQVGLVLGVLFESLAVAAATLLFARAFGLQHKFGIRTGVLRFGPRLILVTAIAAATIYGIGQTGILVPHDFLATSWVARWTTRAGFLFVLTLVQCLVAYATAWIVLHGWGPLRALRDSIRVTTRTFLPTLIVIGVPVLLLYPFHYIVRRADLFINKLSPETMTGLLATRSTPEIGIRYRAEIVDRINTLYGGENLGRGVADETTAHQGATSP